MIPGFILKKEIGFRNSKGAAQGIGVNKGEKITANPCALK